MQFETMSLTRDQLEDGFDEAKVAILHALVKEGLLEHKTVEHWAATHTIILRKNNIFRTFASLWNKHKPSDQYLVIVVKRVMDIPEEKPV